MKKRVHRALLWRRSTEERKRRRAISGTGFVGSLGMPGGASFSDLSICLARERNPRPSIFSALPTSAPAAERESLPCT
jgi:hypothetical protein